MEITDIRLDLLENPRGKLRAFCSLTLDDKFVVKNFKVIKGKRGLFVAMPSRKLTKKCFDCNNRVFRNANYCDSCGGKFSNRDREGDDFKNRKFHADIAFPIEDEFKEEVENSILDAYRRETGGNGPGSPIEHRSDENYDLLDFDFKPMDADETEPEEPSEKKKVKSLEGDGEITVISGDVFSDPGADMRSSRRWARKGAEKRKQVERQKEKKKEEADGEKELEKQKTANKYY